jgi:CRISPR system Cascade subunit CasD
MTALVLKLAAPMQSWGDRSRFVRRETRTEPTKSGVLGLLAAAQGRRRTDPLEDLLQLRFGVRIDQPGRLIRDFQTAKSLDGKTVMPLSYRYYLSDAVFLAVVEGDDSLIRTIDRALRDPVYPLYLGRRSCPPAGPVNQGLRDADLVDVLADEEWAAAGWYRRRHRDPDVPVTVTRDALDPAENGEVIRDLPLSFDPERREYGWRPTIRYDIHLINPDYRHTRNSVMPVDGHDPMAELGGF